MISKEEVQHIAKLVRLELSENEVEKMQKNLSSILDYFDILKKAPKVSVEKTAKDVKNVLRKDLAVVKVPGLVTALVEAAPDKKDGYIRVKSIL